MKKILSAIMMAVLGVTGVMADNNTDDENPGGWDFQVPGLTVKSVEKDSPAETAGVHFSEKMSASTWARASR